MTENNHLTLKEINPICWEGDKYLKGSKIKSI